jgi:hypothetical protein
VISGKMPGIIPVLRLQPGICRPVPGVGGTRRNLVNAETSGRVADASPFQHEIGLGACPLGKSQSEPEP